MCRNCHTSLRGVTLTPSKQSPEPVAPAKTRRKPAAKKAVVEDSAAAGAGTDELAAEAAGVELDGPAIDEAAGVEMSEPVVAKTEDEPAPATPSSSDAKAEADWISSGAKLLSGPESIKAPEPEPQPRRAPHEPAPKPEDYDDLPPWQPDDAPAAGAQSNSYGYSSDSAVPASGSSPSRDELPIVVDDGIIQWKIIAAVTVLMAVLTYSTWYFLIRTPGPEETLTGFFQACTTQDLETMKPYLTKNSLDLIDAVGYDRANRTTPMTGGDLNMQIVGTSYEGSMRETAVVQVRPGNAPPGVSLTFDFVLQKEDGGWKIDLPETGNRMVRSLYRLSGRRGVKASSGSGPSQ